jgi:hypothetical protein
MIANGPPLIIPFVLLTIVQALANLFQARLTIGALSREATALLAMMAPATWGVIFLVWNHWLKTHGVKVWIMGLPTRLNGWILIVFGAASFVFNLTTDIRQTEFKPTVAYIASLSTPTPVHVLPITEDTEERYIKQMLPILSEVNSNMKIVTDYMEQVNQEVVEMGNSSNVNGDFRPPWLRNWSPQRGILENTLKKVAKRLDDVREIQPPFTIMMTHLEFSTTASNLQRFTQHYLNWIKTGNYVDYDRASNYLQTAAKSWGEYVEFINGLTDSTPR